MDKTKLIKGKSGAFGLTSDGGATVDVLQPEARLIQGKSGAWGITSDGGKSVDVLNDFDESSIDQSMLYKPNAPAEKPQVVIPQPQPQASIIEPPEKTQGQPTIAAVVKPAEQAEPQPAVTLKAPASAHSDQDAQVNAYMQRNNQTQPFENTLKMFPELDQQYQQSKLAFNPSSPDIQGHTTPNVANKNTLQALGQSQDTFINDFASKIKGKYDPATNSYLNSDGERIDPGSYKVGDILGVNKGMNSDKGQISGNFVRLVQNDDGTKDWKTIRDTDLPNPNFNNADADALPNVNVSPAKFTPVNRTVAGIMPLGDQKARDMTQAESDDYNTHLASTETNPDIKELFDYNNRSDMTGGTTLLPRFLVQNPQVKQVLATEIADNQGKLVDIEGRKDLVDAAVTKSYSMDVNSLDLAKQHPDVDQQKFMSNLSLLNNRDDDKQRNLAIGRMEALKQRASTISTMMAKSTDEDKKADYQKTLDGLQKDMQQLATDNGPAIASYQAASAYFGSYNMSWFKDLLAKQNKGRSLLAQTHLLFPKMDERDADKLQSDEDPDNAASYILKKFGGAVADILTSTVQLAGQVLPSSTADSIATGGQSSRAERSYFNDLKERQQGAFYSTDNTHSAPIKVLGDVAAMAPYFLASEERLGTIAAKVINGAAMVIPEYLNKQKEANMQGLDGASANVYAALSTVPTAVALGMFGGFAKEGEAAAKASDMSIETFKKILTPATRQEGIGELANAIRKDVAVGAAKQVLGHIAEASKFSAAHVLNTVVNTVANGILQKHFDTSLDVPNELGNMLKMAAAMSVVPLAASFVKGVSASSTAHNNDVQNFYLNLAAEGKPKEALDYINVLRNSEPLTLAEHFRLDDVESNLTKIAENRFPKGFTNAQKVLALPIMNRIDEIKSDAENSHEALRPAMMEEVKGEGGLNEQLAAIAGNAGKASADLKESLAPVADKIGVITKIFAGDPEEITKPVQLSVEPISTKTEDKTPEPEAVDVTVGEMMDKPVTYKGQNGTLTQDGQTVVFKAAEGKKEYEIGNIDAIKDTPTSDHGITHEQSVVSTNADSDITVRDTPYKNNFSDPFKAINKDAEGNITSVNLETVDGKKRTFRGNIAEDIAYQIHLKEIDKDNASKSEFEQFLNTEPAARQEIDNAAVQSPAEDKAVEPDADVPSKKAEPAESTVQDSGPVEAGEDSGRGDTGHNESTQGDLKEEPVEKPKPAPRVLAEGELPSTSIKNATVEAERGTPIEKETERTFGHVLDEAKAELAQNSTAATHLTQEINEKARPITDKEDAMLLLDRNRLRIERKNVAAQLENAETPEEKIMLAKRESEIADAIKANDDAVIAAGRQNGLGLNARRMMLKEDYSLDGMERNVRSANHGEDLSESQKKALLDISKKSDDLEKREAAFAEKQKAAENEKADQDIIDNTKAAAKREKTNKSANLSPADRAIKRLEAFQKKLRTKVYDATLGVPIAIIDSGITVIKTAIKAGKLIADAIEMGIEHIKGKYGEHWAKEGDFRNDMHDELGDLAEKSEIRMEKGKLKIPKSLPYELVKGGVKDIHELVSTVHEMVKKQYPDATERQVRDALTDYGKTVDPTDDKVKSALSEMNSQGRLISSLENAEEGLKPLKSGLQFKKQSDIVRRLKAEVKDAMKRNGVDADTRTEGEKWASALDAVKTRLTNRITDLNEQIKKGQKDKPKVGVEYDTKAKELKAEADRLQKVLNDMVGKPELTDEQRISLATRAVERSIADIDEKIDKVKKGDFTVEEKKKLPQSDSLDALKKDREAKKELLKSLIPEDIIEQQAQERSLKAFKTRTTNSIADLKERLRTGDFSKKERRVTVLDKEGEGLQLERANLKKLADIEIAKAKYANLPKYEKGLAKLKDMRRAAILSGVSVLAKLGNSAFQIMAAVPTEDIIGSFYSLPGKAISKMTGGKVNLNRIGEKAPVEGGGFQKSAMLNFFKEIGSKDTYKDSWNIIKTGRGKLNTMHDTERPDSDAWYKVFGNLHAAIKNPIKRAVYEASVVKRTMHLLRTQTDPVSESQDALIRTNAYVDAKRAIFQGNNLATDAYKSGLAALDRHSDTGKAVAAVARFFMPIVEVPTNFALMTSRYAVGGIYATGELAWAAKNAGWSISKGIESLTPEQADMTMRNFKKNGLGGLIITLGYFSTGALGGYYTGRRKQGDLEAKEIDLFGVKLPAFMAHSPLMECLQIGATLRRVQDADAEKGGDGAVWKSIASASLGVAEEIPFINTPSMISRSFKKDETGMNLLGEQLRSLFEPTILQEAATVVDKINNGSDAKRNPDGLSDQLKMGIPGLRGDVPLK